jgi:putative transposase
VRESTKLSSRISKNNEYWNSFFTLLRLKREGRVPPFMIHDSPPRYWNDKDGKRKLLIVVDRTSTW